jgi:general secretion pathway protein D
MVWGFRTRRISNDIKDIDEVCMGSGKPTLSRAYGLAVRTLPSALLFVCFVGLSSNPANAQSAKSWAKKGDAAEQHDDFDAAYEAYRQAHLKKPKEMPYQIAYERLRFQAAVAHVDRGRVLKESGDIQGALAEFTKALSIDPSNQAAQQQIQIIQSPPVVTPSAGAMEQMAGQNEVLKNINSVAGPVQLQHVSTEPITYHAVEDAKIIYQAIGKSAGLNVLFDPDFQSKRIPVDLNSVSPLDALRIVGTIANAFYKPVTPNTIFIAQNNRTKHTDLDELAIQTFYLTNAIAPNDANEVVTTLRNLLDPSIKVYPVLSQNAIVMRATPDELLLAQKLLNDLDRTRPEVVVDVAVLEVNRDKIRNLGITLPSSITITPQATPTATTSSSSGSTTTTSTSPSNFTLNTLANMNATNFAVSVSGATLNALLNDTDTHILQNPRIRATDGQRSTLKIGSRIPVATGSYNAGVATGTASIGVQTQFQYLDIGVNIDMTPTVHYDREITLKLTIEVLSQTGSVTISGVTEPIIGQRTANQVIQLKEGEPSILAGIITHEDNKTVTGTPGLGELPFIKYFFSTQGRETQQNEIVFLMIPHIVRESILTRLNTRAIDTGTMQDIYLRQNQAAEGDNSALAPVNGGAAPPTVNGASQGAGSVAASVLNQIQQESQRPTAPATNATPTPAAPTTAQPQAVAPTGPPVSLNVVPSTSNQTVGSTFQVAVMLGNGTDVYSVPMQLQFNPAVLQLVNVDSGEFLSKDGQAVALSHRDDGNGMVTISISRPPGVAGITGAGSVATLTFKAIAPGDSNLSLVKVGARNSSLATLPVVGSQSTVHVK